MKTLQERELEEAILLLQFIRFQDGVHYFRQYAFWRDEVMGLSESEILKKHNLINGEGIELDMDIER